MFTIKAKKGNVNLSVFNLSELTNKANAKAEAIQEHNRQVYCLFRDLVTDYLFQINNVLVSELGLPAMETYNKEFYIFHTARGLHIKFHFGHGRGAIELEFLAPYQQGSANMLSCDFTGKIVVTKRWLENKLDVQSHTLESVAQFFDVCADVFKMHIIGRDVKDLRQQMEIEKELIY